jgi:chorismate mutase
MEKKLRAIRGAFQCRNEAEDLEAQLIRVYDEILTKNTLEEADIVSLVFSVTGDLDALNPAAALRRSGRGRELALFCVPEASFREGLDHAIRLLLHVYMEEESPVQHVYRNGAEVLRPDRQ